MTQLNQIYKCSVCGNIVEVVHASIGTLVCCSKPMELQTEKTIDIGKEKHVPVIEKTKTGVKVKVGEIEHPMEEKHHIEFIEIIADNKVEKKYLKPGEKPEAEFNIQTGILTARAYCNIHGLWKK
jgi:superoxide reductase